MRSLYSELYTVTETDLLPAMTAAQSRLSVTIDAFYADNSDAAMSAHSYRRAVEELEGKTARELDAPYRATVLEPIGKMCSYWGEINNTISKRNKKLLDYDAARTKARKLVERPSDDPSKLPLAERQADEAKESTFCIQTVVYFKSSNAIFMQFSKPLITN